MCDVVNWDVGSFFISVTIKHRVSLASWTIVCVYGPADFLGEIQDLVGAKQAADIPIVLGGNVVRIAILLYDCMTLRSKLTPMILRL